MDLFILCVACLTVFVNCLVTQFAIFLLWWYFVVKCYGGVESVGSALLDRTCMVFQQMCVVPVLPVWVYILLPWFVCVCVCQRLSPHLRA